MTLTRDGNDSLGGNRAGPNIIDPVIGRYWPHIIVSEQANNNGSLATQRARWEAIQRAGRSLRVTLKADSWLDSAGTPWTPNQLTPLSIPSMGLNDLTWAIIEVTYKRDGRSGTTAKIVLMPPEALTVEPSALDGLSMGMISPDKSSGGSTGAALALLATQPTAPNAADAGRRDRPAL